MKKLEGEEEPRGDELQLGVLSNLKKYIYIYVCVYFLALPPKEGEVIASHFARAHLAHFPLKEPVLRGLADSMDGTDRGEAISESVLCKA